MKRKQKKVKTEGPIFELDEFVVTGKRLPRGRGGAGGGRKATTYQAKPYSRKEKKPKGRSFFGMFGRRSVD